MNQNKGIGAYQNRPGYFMGGMIGGAILGALVNKIQGKDWKRGALMGGIGGGLGSWAGKALMPAAGTSPSQLSFLQKMLYTAPNKAPGAYALRPFLSKFGGAGLGAIAGTGAAYLAGDPEYDKRKQEEAMLAEMEERKRRNRELYGDWYTNPWEGWNTGGMINARPGYYNGGPAGIGGTWSDVPMEEGGPTQDPIPLQLPMGQEGSFEDENESILGLELAGLSNDERAELQSLMSLRLVTPKDDPKYEQIEMRIQELMGRISAQTGRSIGPAGASTVSDDGTRMMAMSESHPDEGYYDLFFDHNGRYPKDREELDLFLEGMDLDTVQAAQGGYMERPQYEGGGTGDMDLTQGGASFGVGTGTSDDIPAMLSDGEFVVTANAVKNLGGGDRMVGAKRMYQMMNSLDPNSQTPAEMDTTGIA